MLDYKILLSERLSDHSASGRVTEDKIRYWKANPILLPVSWAEHKVGCSIAGLREAAWVKGLLKKRTILIDTPDYSKTDRRLMAKDLMDIYWLWNSFSNTLDDKPNLVIAIQKEMFRIHFFFDKMVKVELPPLEPKQMLEAYQRRFKTTHPFTEDALLTIARLSRGIFRRFLRYITLTLDPWTTQPEPQTPIDPENVKKTINYQILAEDMELELLELFPKHSDLRLQAVQLLNHLSESGPQRQTQLAEELNLAAYTMSRLLSKLESHQYITREREGTDKIVSLKRD